MGGIGSISLWKVEDPTRFGIVGTNSQNRIERFLEKPKKEEVFSNWINAGIYILEPEIFDFMEPDKNISIEREVFPLILDKGLFGFKFEGYMIDAGTPETYIQAHEILLRESGKKRLVGENSDIAKNVKLEPYTCLGSNVTVKEGTIISNSVILDKAKIGMNCTINRCIIGQGANLEDDVKVVEGAVIDNNCTVKKGTNVPSNAKIEK
jgi:mannose-1-phosphate guanylyltransferase